jgi:heme-degrading monooxygenase HmoA
MAVVVLTTIPVKEGSIDEVARIFEETNRALVDGHAEWRGAWFTANRQRSEITNVAHWDSAEAYERLRASDEFEQTMAQFTELFVGPPNVSINDLLVHMTP